MKKIALISAIALGSLFYNSANAQILQIGLNIGGHRPVIEASLATPNVAVTYSNADDYYYLPDVDAYYCIPEKVYYYNNGVNWVPVAYLPGEYSNYDWRAARHYEVRARRPFLNADVYRERYNGRVYDWRRYNDRRYDVRRNDRFDHRPDNRFDNRRDNRFDNRRDDRPDNRNQRNDQPVFRRNDQPRGIEHSTDRNRGRNDNNQRNNDHFADNQNHGGSRGFSRS